jgi:hypothetical protein
MIGELSLTTSSSGWRWLPGGNGIVRDPQGNIAALD